MSAQRSLFEPLSHRDGPETEKLAGAKVASEAVVLRARVLAIARYCGADGITGWEAGEAIGKHHSIRQRLSELADERHGAVLIKSEMRRPNGRGNSEVVYIAREYAQP